MSKLELILERIRLPSCVLTAGLSFILNAGCSGSATTHDEYIGKFDSVKKITQEYGFDTIDYTKGIQDKKVAQRIAECLDKANNAETKPEEVIMYCDEAIELGLRNKSYDVYYFRGLAKKNLGRFNEAIEDFTKTIQINPHFLLAYFARGKMYLKLKRFDEAIREYDVIGDMNIVDSYYSFDYRLDALHAKIDVYEEQGKYDDDLIACYEKKARMCEEQGKNVSEIFDCHRNIAGIYKKQKKYDKAIAYYTKSIKKYGFANAEACIADYIRECERERQD